MFIWPDGERADAGEQSGPDESGQDDGRRFQQGENVGRLEYRAAR